MIQNLGQVCMNSILSLEVLVFVDMFSTFEVGNQCEENWVVVQHLVFLQNVMLPLLNYIISQLNISL